MTALLVCSALIGGALLWTVAEYLLHRFAMHALHGKGIMSREHLEHHVKAGWNFSPTMLLSWLGVVLVSAALWLPVGWLIAGPLAGASLATGWVVGYFFYEYQHASAHLHAPRGRYGRWLRRHHFHHHFGHPMANHGVSVAWFDHVFGSHQRPDRVRVPRRMAMPWMLDADGELRPEYVADYELVGVRTVDERTAMLDRARAFTSVAPED